MNQMCCVFATIAFLSMPAAAIEIGQEVSTAGDLVLIDTPDVPITKGTLTSETEIRLFQEQSAIELVEPVLVDIRQPGVYPPLTLPPSTELATFVPAGTAVDVYFLHFDPGRRMPPFTQPPQVTALTGEVTFEYPILGLIVRQPQFQNSDELEHPDVDYLRYSALEIQPDAPLEIADSIQLSPDRRTLSVDFSITTNLDQVRILVSTVPEPSTMATALVALLGVVVAKMFRP